jgi:dihydroorotase
MSTIPTPPDSATPAPIPVPILIRGGHVLDPAAALAVPAPGSSASVSHDGVGQPGGLQDVLLEGGRIAAIAAPGSLDARAAAAGASIVDATGLIVCPGLIDIHVHLREPGQTWKETIATGTAAAAAGGFTTVCAMPNTVPVNDTPELTLWMQAPERNAAIRVIPIAAATVGSMGVQLTDYPALKAAGAAAVSDDGKPIGVGAAGDEIMREALRHAAHTGLPVIQHAEDTRLTGGCSMNAGALAFRLGLRGMPVEAESSLVERDIQLLRELRDAPAEAPASPSEKPHRHAAHAPRLHVAHLSTAKALDAVRVARAEGLHVTCEVMPHHFALNEDAVDGYNTLAKMNPPLRSEDDRQAMLAGLMDGTVDCLATDHAPHATHEKEQEFELAPNGITGLETALGLALSILHAQQGMPLARVLALLTAAPARVLSFKDRGTLTEGAWADVLIFDPAAEWTFHAAASKSRSKNTPFDGWPMLGQVHWTISEGRIAYRLA